MTRTVLCYGDSNTYGYIPGTHGRYDSETRWTGVLSRLLGDDYRVIEEGLSGRTAGRDNAEEGWKNGFDYLRPCLLSHMPLDCLVIMLGTNDCKLYMNQSPEMIRDSMIRLAQEAESVFAEKSADTRIVICSPVPIDDAVVSSEYGTAFFDAGQVTEVSPVDCEHLTPEGHRAIAEALSVIIRNLCE